MKIHVKTCDDIKCSKKKCFSTCENCTIFINGVCVFVLGSVSLSLGHSCTVALQACSVPYPLLVLPLSQVQGPVNGQAQVTHPTSPGQSGGSQGGLFCTCKNKQYHLILHQTNSSAQASSLPKPHTTNQISAKGSINTGHKGEQTKLEMGEDLTWISPLGNREPKKKVRTRSQVFLPGVAHTADNNRGLAVSANVALFSRPGMSGLRSSR